MSKNKGGKMRAVVLLEPGKLAIKEIGRPSCKENQALVSVRKCGICGSDVTLYSHRPYFGVYPVIQGHEFAGVIEEMQPNTTRFKVGEKVTVNPLLACGKCFNCRSQKTNLCSNPRFLGYNVDGALAKLVVVPTNCVVPLPEEMDFEQGALIEPTAIAVHAVGRTNWKPCARIVVIGAGPIGLLVTQIIKLDHSTEVMVADKRQHQVNLAKIMGADHVVNVSERNLRSYVADVFGKESVDLVFECAGVEQSIRDALSIMRGGTSIVMVSQPPLDLLLPIVELSLREIDILGVGLYSSMEFLTAVELIRRRLVKVDSLITHRFSLDEVKRAYDLGASRKEGVCKIMVEI